MLRAHIGLRRVQVDEIFRHESSRQMRRHRRLLRHSSSNLAGNRSQELASNQLRLLAREIQAPVQGEVQVP